MKPCARRLRRFWALPVLVLLPAPAQAHLVQTGFGGFYDGIAHVLVTAQDLLLVLALGLLAGLRGKPESRQLIVLLPATWVVAGWSGAALFAGRELDGWTTFSLVLVGGLVAADARVPKGVLGGIAVVAGSLHGLANGASLAAQGEPWLAMTGVGLAVFTLATLAAALVVSLRAEWSRVAVRVGGSWVAACGILLLAWSLRGPGST